MNSRLKMFENLNSDPSIPAHVIKRNGMKFPFCTPLSGFKLESSHFDVNNVKEKKAFKVIDCIESEAIELEFTQNDELKVIKGHHTLG